MGSVLPPLDVRFTCAAKRVVLRELRPDQRRVRKVYRSIEHRDANRRVASRLLP
jgi:hypothetical protein